MGARTAFIIAIVGTAATWSQLFTREDAAAVATSPRLQSVSRQTAATRTIEDLNRELQSGMVQLSFEPPRGYLKSVLGVLGIPIESQMLVYSETSLQSAFIRPGNPRALYFNDAVAVGWVKGAPTLEVAALDAEHGVAFYTLPQVSDGVPQFVPESERCLQCHRTPSTGGATGMLAMSMLPLADNVHEYAQGWPVDHRTPIHDRWGGWYVTGDRVPSTHLGNVPVHHAKESYVRLPKAPVLPALSEDFIRAYLSPHSDVVAHLVFNHQVGAVNLLSRLVAEFREASAQGQAVEARVAGTVNELVDYLLFIDEAAIPDAVRGASGFAEVFAATGPRDRRGRSLRELDLETRLLRYPCSYMIYAAGFDALPGALSEMVYARLWDVLSAAERSPAYSGLSRADRRAIVEILIDTKNGLPRYFHPSEVR